MTNPNASYIEHGKGGTAIVGPDATMLFAAVALRSSINLYMKTGIIPTRGVTITKMLALAKQYTGKVYKAKDKEQAIADLDVWIATMKAAMPVVEQ